MKVGLVGAGEMGLAMGGHVLDKGFEIGAYDIDAGRREAARARGLKVAESLGELAADTEVFVLVVATDAQVISVCEELADKARDGAIIVVAATILPDTIRALAPMLAKRNKRIVDAPVVYGSSGAREGKLLSLCGGDAADFEKVRPVMLAYGRDALHVGDHGAGEVAKACNNLLHWQHCVGNFEALLIAKAEGIDAQRMREVLIQCPGNNGTLERWDTTRFTWQEKDMDITMDMAQRLGLVLPLSGQVDQLVKLLKADDVKGLLYGEETTYLGRTVAGRPANAN